MIFRLYIPFSNFPFNETDGKKNGIDTAFFQVTFPLTVKSCQTALHFSWGKSGPKPLLRKFLFHL